MKKTYRLLCLTLCALLLGGCAPANLTGGGTTTEANVPESTAAPTVSPTTEPTTEPTTLPLTTLPPGAITTVPPIGQGTDPAGEPVDFANASKTRIAYIGNRNSVRYVTTVDGLPEELLDKGYDAAFFAEHGLLVVVETTNSGSVDVGVESVTRNGDTVTVLLSHDVEPDAYVTNDMATWLLWAEMPAGLETCAWELGNPAIPSALATE